MEIRRSYDRLISTMGFPIPVRRHLYIESGPKPLSRPMPTSFVHSRICASLRGDELITALLHLISCWTMLAPTCTTSNSYISLILMDLRQDQSQSAVLFLTWVEISTWINKNNVKNILNTLKLEQNDWNFIEYTSNLMKFFFNIE